MASLRNGPMMTYMSDTEVRFWFQLTASGTCTVTITGETPQSKSPAIAPFIDHVVFTGLTANTIHEYTIKVDSDAARGPYKFHTFPVEGSGGYFEILVCCDNHWVDNPNSATIDTIYNNILNFIGADEALVPRLMLCQGDFQITDNSPGNTNELDDLATRIEEHALVRATDGGPDSGFFKLCRHVPFFSVWDDWDYGGNNSDGEGLTAAQRAVLYDAHDKLFQGHPTWPDTGSRAVYQEIKVADCVVLMTDGRAYKSKTPGGGGGSGTPSDIYRATPPWDWENDDIYWGAEQIAWIKARLTANKSSPFKFLTNGTTFFDNSSTRGGNKDGPTGRDSLGIYHRRERNELLDFLAKNPDEHSGSCVITGDNHSPVLRYGIPWKIAAEDPLNDGALDRDPKTPTHRFVHVPELAMTAINAGTALPAGLSQNWWGNPHEIFLKTSARNFGWIKVDSKRCPREAIYQWWSIGQPEITSPVLHDIYSLLYEFFCREGDWFFPPSIYHTVDVVPSAHVQTPTAYAAATAPVTATTPKPAPSDAYTPKAAPSTAYAAAAAPVTAHTPKSVPVTALTPAGVPATAFTPQGAVATAMTPQSVPSVAYVARPDARICPLLSADFEPPNSVWALNSRATIVSSPVHGGANSLELEGVAIFGGTVDEGVATQVAIVLDNGAKYEVFVWANPDSAFHAGGGRALNFRFDLDNGDGSYNTLGNLQKPNIPAGWSRQSIGTFTAIGTVGRVQLVGDVVNTVDPFYANVGQWYIDDIEFCQTDPAPKPVPVTTYTGGPYPCN